MVVASIAAITSRPSVLEIPVGSMAAVCTAGPTAQIPARQISASWVGGCAGRSHGLGRVVGVRLTELRGLMQAQFGPLRAPSVASDHVFSALQGRTMNEALAAGADPKAVWLAVCDDFDVSDTLRYGLPD
jgi:hypothetical protein